MTDARETLAIPDVAVAPALPPSAPDDGDANAVYLKHVDRVHWLLRITLTSAQAAEEALCETFVEASRLMTERADEGRSGAFYVSEAVLTQIRRRNRAVGPAVMGIREPASKPRDAGHRRSGLSGEQKKFDIRAVDGLTDASLSILVRTLEPAVRQALILGIVLGLDDGEVSRVIGCSTGEMAGLRKRGLIVLRDYVAGKEHEQLVRAALAQKAAPHIRHIPIIETRGTMVLRGDRVHLEDRGMMALARKAIEKFIEIVRRKFHPENDIHDDDVGDVGKHGGRKLDPTPTLRPFQMPKLTPSLTEYEQPQATRGMASYRQPKGTPSTARISNRSQPLGSRSGNHAWSRNSRSFL